jgi:hypothetical protein
LTQPGSRAKLRTGPLMEVSRSHDGSRRPLREALHRGDSHWRRDDCGLVAAGKAVDTIVAHYALRLEQVRAALANAAHIVDLPPAVRQVS